MMKTLVAALAAVSFVGAGYAKLDVLSYAKRDVVIVVRGAGYRFPETPATLPELTAAQRAPGYGTIHTFALTVDTHAAAPDVPADSYCKRFVYAGSSGAAACQPVGKSPGDGRRWSCAGNCYL